MRRKLNVKFLFLLGALLLVASGGMALAHHMQYKRLPLALLRQSVRAEDAKDWQRADEYLRRYLDFEPGDIEQKARLARMITNPQFPDVKRHSARAYFLLQDVLSSDRERHDLRRLLVPLAIEMNQLAAAEEHLKVMPTDAETSNLWGRYNEAKGQTDDAIESYREAVSRDSTSVDAVTRFVKLIRARRWDNLSKDDRARKRQDDAAEAEKSLDELVKGNPDMWQARVARWNYKREYVIRQERGETWPEIQRLAFAALTHDAARDVTRALELREGEPNVRLAAAEAAQMKGDLEGAKKHLDKARQLHRRDPRIFKAYAGLELLIEEKLPKEKTLEKQQARARAIAWLRQGALELAQPVQFDLQWAHASLLLDTGGKAELDEADKVIAKIRTLNVTPAGVDYLQGRLLMARQQWAEASKLLERCKEPLKDAAEMINQIDLCLGRCYEELNDPKRQYETYTRLAKRNPDSLAARLGLANAARANNDLDEALRLLGDIARAPEVPATVWADQVRLSILKARQTNRAADWTRVEETIADAHKHKVIDEVEADIFRAECLVAHKQEVKAHEVLEALRQKNPQRVEPWVALATLAERRKDPREARRLLDEASKALTKPAEQVELRLARANHWAGQQSEQGRAELKKLSEDVEKLEPAERNRLLSGLAEANYRAGNLDQAAKLWKQLAQQEEYRADLRLRLMLFDLALQDGNEAEMTAVLKEVKALEGEDGTFARHAEAMRLIWTVRQGKVRDKEKREALTDAVRLLDQVRVARPQWTPALLARAEVETLRRNPDQAITFYAAAFQLGDRSPTLLRAYVEALRQKGKEGIAQANKLLSSLKQEDLVRADLERAAVSISLLSHGPDRVIDQVFKTVRSDSRDYRDHLWLGRTLAATGRKPVEAEQALRKAIELNGKEAEPWIALVHFLSVHGRKKDVPQLLGVAQTSIQAEKASLAMARCYALIDDPKKANECYKKALDEKPRDGAVLSDYASFLMQKNDPASAEPLLRRLIEDDVKKSQEETEWAHGRLAVVLSARGDFSSLQEALPHVGLKLTGAGEISNDASILSGDSLYVKRVAARVLASCNLWRTRTAAIERLEELDQRQSLTSEDRFLLAALYEKKNDWPRARATLSKLVLDSECQPQHVAHYIRELLSHKELAQAQRLIERLEAAHKAMPWPGGATLLVELKARWHEAKGEGSQAVELLKERAGLQDADPQEVLLLVASLGRQKRFDAALHLLEQVWKACPPELAGSTSVGLLRAGKTTEAQRKKVEDLLEAALKQHPKNVTLHVQRGDVLDLVGNYQDAEKEYRAALDLEKDNVLALNNLAWLLALRSKKGDEALALIDRAVAKAGPVSELLDTRGVIYWTMGKGKEGLADLQEALKESASATRCFHLAQVHLQLDQRNEAKAALRQAGELGLEASQLHPVEQVQYRKLVEELYDR